MCITENTVEELTGWILDYVERADGAEQQLEAVRTLQSFLHEVEHVLVVRLVEERNAARIIGQD